MALNKIDRNELLFTVFDACRCGYFEFIKHIFDANPSDLNITNTLGQNCVMLCCEFNSVQIFKYLMSKKHINCLLSDHFEHWNCLHYALRYGNFRIARLLLQQTLFPKYSNDSNGYNPYDLLPPNLFRKQLYDSAYNTSNRNLLRKIYNASYVGMLQKGHCQRVYGTGKDKIISNLQVQGVLYAWGNNAQDQLGFSNNNKVRSTPKIVTSLRHVSVTDVSCSGYHSIAVTDNGSVYVWGNNSDGRCGIGRCHNEYTPFIKKPYMLNVKMSAETVGFVSCTATLDHSTLLSIDGDVWVWGVDKASKIVKYTKKNKLVWTQRLKPFCISDGRKCDMRSVHSSYERSVVLGMDNRVYMFGRSFSGVKLNELSVIPMRDRDIKKCGVQSACVGENWLVILLMNGVLFSMNKNNEENFSEIRLNKEFRFRHHHNKRDAVKIRYIACYNGDGYGRCMAVATNNDIYEWRAPSTDAYYIGNVNGVMDISVGPKLCIILNNMGECYAFGDQQILGLNSKNKKLLKCNDNTKIKYKPLKTKKMKRANIERIITLSQIGKVFATKNTVFVIQCFLWPNRSLLNANDYHKQMKRVQSKKMVQKFWNSDMTQKDDLYDCYNMFSALSSNMERKYNDDEDEKKMPPKPTKSRHKKRHKRNKKSSKSHKKHHKSAKSKTVKVKPLSELPLSDANDECELNTEETQGLDEEISKVPSLVSYCEDLLIHQIDIQTVISLYKQSRAMGFHRISVFLSFVIIENIQHLLHFLLRDCSENDIYFIEQLFKTKYFPKVNMTWQKYYGDSAYLFDKKRVIEQYRLLRIKYPNFNNKLSHVNSELKKIEIIQQKLKKWTAKIEREQLKNDDSDAEIIYFDSSESEDNGTETDSMDGDRILCYEQTALEKAIQKLDTNDRKMYECKQRLLGEKNRILFQISNPEQFPSSQMMDKWKRRQKKKNNFNTFEDKHKRFREDKNLMRMGIANTFDADKYLKHVYLRNTHDSNVKELQNKIGFSFSFDYDSYKPKNKNKNKQSKAVIYRKFNVREAMEKDLKKARKMDKKQAKQSQKQTKNKQTKNVSGAAKRRKRKKNKNKNKDIIQSPKPQNRNINPTQKPVSNQRFPRSSPHITPNIAPLSPNVSSFSNHESQTISPIDVVRRNREKKILEKELSHLKNDVWDLAEEESKNNNNGKGSLSDILNAQKSQFDNEQKRKKYDKYVKYQETQNAWTPEQIKKEKTQLQKKKSIRPEARAKKPSVIEEAQYEEIQFRSLAQHEYEWMIDAPQNIKAENDDYDTFVKQQEMLLSSFRNETNVSQDMNRNRGYGNEYGQRGNNYSNNRYQSYGNGNDHSNHYNHHRGRGRGRGRGYDGYNNNRYNNEYRGRGRGRNRPYNDNSNQWQRK